MNDHPASWQPVSAFFFSNFQINTKGSPHKKVIGSVIIGNKINSEKKNMFCYIFLIVFLLEKNKIKKINEIYKNIGDDNKAKLIVLD